MTVPFVVTPEVLYVLLFQNKMVATFIPKSAFAGESELAQLKSSLATWLGPRAQWEAGPDMIVAAFQLVGVMTASPFVV